MYDRFSEERNERWHWAMEVEILNGGNILIYSSKWGIPISFDSQRLDIIRILRNQPLHPYISVSFWIALVFCILQEFLRTLVFDNICLPTWWSMNGIKVCLILCFLHPSFNLEWLRNCYNESSANLPTMRVVLKNKERDCFRLSRT